MSKENENLNEVENSALNIADVMWRFSSVILIPIVFFVLLVIRPIKWLITGHYYPQDPQKVKKTWLYKWILKTGLGWFR